MPIDREKARSNHSEIKDFIEGNALRDSKSNIDFLATVTIVTAANKITVSCRVRIDFGGYDNYGIVSILHNDLDPQVYPTQFDAKWPTFSYSDGVLKISDVHKKKLNYWAILCGYST